MYYYPACVHVFINYLKISANSNINININFNIMAMFFIILFIQLFYFVISLRNGVNFQPSYYNNGNVTFGFDLLKKYPQIQSVRIEIEPDKVTQAYQWIQEAHNNGYHIIATYHTSPLGEDNPIQLIEAAQWWIENYMYLKAAGEFTINIRNEWGSHDINAIDYANAYNDAIHMIRNIIGIQPNIPLIIDIPGWGQETHTAAQASPLITDKFIIFSAHIYTKAYNNGYNRTMIPSDMDELIDTGRDCMIGEYGFNDDIGGGGGRGGGRDNGDTFDEVNAPVAVIVQHAQDIGFIGVYAWAWNGDGAAGNGKSLNMVTPNWMEEPLSTNYSESSYFYEVIDLL